MKFMEIINTLFLYQIAKDEMHRRFFITLYFRNILCVIDWKTSKKIKPTIRDTFDNPIQIAAYIGAINNSQLLEKNKVTMPFFVQFVYCDDILSPSTTL